MPRIFVDPQTGSITEIAKKDQTFLRHVAELGPDGAAKYAKISGGRKNHLLKLPAIQQYLRNVLEAAGVTDTLLAQRLREGLDAMTQKEFCTKEGDIIEGAERVDYDQRGKYLDRAFRLQGMDKPEPAQPGGAAGAMPSLGALASLPPEDLHLILNELKRRQAMAEAQDTEAEPAPPISNDDTPTSSPEPGA